MRLLYFDAKNFGDEEMRYRLFSYCENHIVDCVLIINDEDSSMKRKLENKLIGKPLRVINTYQKMRINGIMVDMNEFGLVIENNIIQTYPDTCTYVKVLNKRIQQQLIYMNLMMSVSADPQKNVQNAIDKMLDEILEDIESKNRNYN